MAFRQLSRGEETHDIGNEVWKLGLKRQESFSVERQWCPEPA
jgi:hypothetical protein